MIFEAERNVENDPPFSIRRTMIPSGEEKKWFVLYTKSRNEKKVAEGLRKIGLESFCPMLKTRRKWSDRFKIVEEPLFKSYCFVLLTEKERAKVFAIPGVVRYLFWLKKPAVVRPEEIGAIKEILEHYDHSNIHTAGFSPDDAVRIKSGVLTEMTGTVEKQQKHQLFLYLDALQVVVRVDLRNTDVQKLNQSISG